jgi:anti-sigma B factor antagonist
METVIGVFAARERAEAAVKSLLEQGVPKDSIVYLTRSETEAKSMGKELGAYAGGFVGGAAGLSVGVAAATLLAVPGIGPVFALGFGAAALLGLVGAETGAAVAGGAAKDPGAPASASEEDSAVFWKVLNTGHSLVVVRNDSPQIAATACLILDGLGISMEEGVPEKSRVTTRESDGVTIMDVVGRIVLGDGTALLRDAVRVLLDQGKNRIILNLEKVNYVDSAGLGELVRTHTSIHNRGGKLMLVKPSKNVYDLLRISKLDRVLEIEQNEASALRSLGPESANAQAAG